MLDEIIALIRGSKTADIAKQGLIKDFKFSEIQAQAILDMQLRRLAALERRKLQDEYRELIGLIRTLEELLHSPKKVLALIKQNLIDLKARYGDARRTQIADRVQGTLTTHDLLPDEDVWVTLSPEGTLTRWRRGAEALGGKGTPPHLRQPAPLLASANTRDDLYLFSVKGQATRIGAHQVPEGSGSHFADLSGLTRRDRIAGLIALPKSSDQLPRPEDGQSSFLLLATVQGKVKRVAVADLIDQASADPQVIGLDEGDELLWAGVSPGGGEFLLVTAQGQAIRFAEDDVRSMGLPAGGIGGVKLAAKDRVVAAMVIAAMTIGKGASAQPHVAVITSLGIGKRVPVVDFPVQGRNGQGVVVAKPTPKLGSVAGAALVGPGDIVLCLTAGGGAKPVPAAAVPEMGRPAQGKSMMPLVGGDQVTRIVAVAAEQRTKVRDEVEVKAEAKGEPGVKARKTAAGATKAAPAKKVEVRARAEAGGKPGKATAGAAKTPPAPAVSATPQARTRKTATAQPSLLTAEAPPAMSKPPTKPAAAPQGEPSPRPVRASSAPKAAPGGSTSAAPQVTKAKSEPVSGAAQKPATKAAPAGRTTTPPASVAAPKAESAKIPARPPTKGEPAAPVAPTKNAPKQPAKSTSAATPQTEPAKAPASPTARAKPATPSEPAKSAARQPAKPTSAATPQAPAPATAKTRPAAPAEKPAAKATSMEKPGGTAAKPAASKAPGPVAKGK